MKQIERGGYGAMEMVALNMKALGMYLSRSLSFKGVHFSLLEHKVRLSAIFTRIFVGGVTATAAVHASAKRVQQLGEAVADALEAARDGNDELRLQPPRDTAAVLGSPSELLPSDADRLQSAHPHQGDRSGPLGRKGISRL